MSIIFALYQFIYLEEKYTMNGVFRNGTLYLLVGDSRYLGFGNTQIGMEIFMHMNLK